MNRKIAPLALALLAVATAPAAFAQSKGTITVGLGVHNVAPKSNLGSVAGGAIALRANDSARPTITGEYFVADNLGIELIAALPFQHNISAKVAGVDVGKIGSTKHLPPTLSLQYHFAAPDAKIKPFVGAGLNYTWFYGESTTGALAGSRLDLRNTVGAALHGGVDFAMGKGAIRVDGRWINIQPDVKVDGVKVGKAEVDPFVYGVAYVMKF